MEEDSPFYKETVVNGVQRGASPEDIVEECIRLLCQFATLRRLTDDQFNRLLNLVKRRFKSINLSEELIEKFNRDFPREET